MGRKKISITRLTDERNRQITFSKRKAGLLKKAYELSILCDVEIAVIMITSNNKLYQYASSNMNSILIRYTDFKDPDENKTNADILDDITKKDRGGLGQDDSGDEDSSSQSFMVTPRTQENFRRIDKEFDHLLRTNQVPSANNNNTATSGTALTPLGSAPPSVMPVSVPVGFSPNSVQQQIQQHLQCQMENQKSSIPASLGSAGLGSAGLGSAGLGSAGLGSSGLGSAGLSSSSLGSGSTMFSPQSELSSASPLTSGRGHRSPTNMPPPLGTPTRLQTLRNQTLKLHLPGSGRNYISLPTGQSPSGEGGSSANKKSAGGGGEGEEPEESRDTSEGAASRPGAKPQLRVYIPGQKEFVPKTHDPPALPQASLAAHPAAGGVSLGGAVPTTTSFSTTTTESLTTPVLSLTTPNIFSSLPPIFSSLISEFPFGHTPQPSAAAASVSTSGVGGGGGTGGGGAGGGDSSAALVAFPVSIQPSATGGSGAGNLILQAQNMGQPFLLTPTYDSRQNPLFSSQGGYTPPTTSLAAGLSPSIGGIQNLEQLKLQYERTQQMIQQQLLYTQMQMLQQQQDKDGGQAEEEGGAVSSIANTSSATSTSTSVMPHPLRGLEIAHTSTGTMPHPLRGMETAHTSISAVPHPLRGLETAHTSTANSSSGSGSRVGGGGGARGSGNLPQYINGSDVMIGSHSSSSQSQLHPVGGTGRGRQSEEDGNSAEPPPDSKKARLDTSVQ